MYTQQLTLLHVMNNFSKITHLLKSHICWLDSIRLTLSCETGTTILFCQLLSFYGKILNSSLFGKGSAWVLSCNFFLHIFRRLFPKNTSGGLLLNVWQSPKKSPLNNNDMKIWNHEFKVQKQPFADVLQNRCCWKLVNTVKFRRTAFSIEHLQWLLLKVAQQFDVFWIADNFNIHQYILCLLPCSLCLIR